MIEVVVIVVLLALLGWEKYQNRQERAKMLNMIVSKNAEEQVNMDMADKTQIKLQDRKEVAEPEFVEESQQDDKGFDKRIQEELGR